MSTREGATTAPGAIGREVEGSAEQFRPSPLRELTRREVRDVGVRVLVVDERGRGVVPPGLVRARQSRPGRSRHEQRRSRIPALKRSNG